MSFMDTKNILTEAQIDNLLKVLRNNGLNDMADKARTSKKLQKKLIDLDKSVQKSNVIRKKVDKYLKPLTIADYL